MRIFIILFLFYLIPAHCGFEHSQVGARPRALGAAYTAAGGDPWAMYYNPAGLTQMRKAEASFYYSPQPFGVSELSQAVTAVAIPMSFGVVGAGAGMFGFALYKETSLNVSVAANISGMSIGVNLYHYSVSIERYGSNSTIGVDVGLCLDISANMGVGMRIRNINAPAIGVSKEKLPQSFSTGIKYTPLSTLMMVVDYQKDVSFDASPKFGVEYRLIPLLALRVGISDSPSEYHGGLGIRYSAFSFDYALSTHQELGWTHEMSIAVRWGGYDEK